MLDRQALLRATAANHRAWGRRWAAITGGRAMRSGRLEIVIAGDEGRLAFPGAAARSAERLDGAIRAARAIGVRRMACWSLAEDPVLGTLLLARGFEWGWQPHWMALDLKKLPDEEPTHEVAPVQDGLAEDLPYATDGPHPRAIAHLGAFRNGRIAGHVFVNPWRGIAGIYSMGVVPSQRRQGIGRALTLAAGRLARQLGCTHVVLNATPEGELLYRTVGFQSLGLGQTWWMHPGPRPTHRQTQLVEAIGFGDIDRLASLRPTRAELGKRIPGAGTPLAIAVVIRRTAAAECILNRRPDLISLPVDPRGATLLHVAVESDNEELLELALARGADPHARDHIWNGTALGWAEHLGRPGLAALLRQPHRNPGRPRVS